MVREGVGPQERNASFEADGSDLLRLPFAPQDDNVWAVPTKTEVIGRGNKRKDDSDGNSLSVPELRKRIPIFMRHHCSVHDDLRAQTSKVRNMWKVLPKGWPSDVPFVDPNNYERGTNQKPPKYKLVQMYNYLQSMKKKDLEGQKCKVPEDHQIPLQSASVEDPSKNNNVKASSVDADLTQLLSTSLAVQSTAKPPTTTSLPQQQALQEPRTVLIENVTGARPGYKNANGVQNVEFGHDQYGIAAPGVFNTLNANDISSNLDPKQVVHVTMPTNPGSSVSSLLTGDVPLLYSRGPSNTTQPPEVVPLQTEIPSIPEIDDLVENGKFGFCNDNIEDRFDDLNELIKEDMTIDEDVKPSLLIPVTEGNQKPATVPITIPIKTEILDDEQSADDDLDDIMEYMDDTWTGPVMNNVDQSVLTIRKKALQRCGMKLLRQRQRILELVSECQAEGGPDRDHKMQILQTILQLLERQLLGRQLLERQLQTPNTSLITTKLQMPSIPSLGECIQTLQVGHSQMTVGSTPLALNSPPKSSMLELSPAQSEAVQRDSSGLTTCPVSPHENDGNLSQYFRGGKLHRQVSRQHPYGRKLETVN